MNTPQPVRRQALRARARHLARAAARGVTLVEVLIVVAIMALIAGGVSFFVLPKLAQARVDTSCTNAKSMRQVAISYRTLRGKGECPTINKLLEAGELDEGSATKDAWDKPFKIICDGNSTKVMSAGPDEQEGSPDDIVFPGCGEKGAETKEGK